MTERVLEVAIIHQSAETRNTLHAAVSQTGHKVCLLADNGREFVQRARAQRPDLAIVQRCLPDMDGLQALREAGGAIPTIVVIDESNCKLPAGAESDDVFAIVETPIHPSEVIPAISLAMRHMDQLQSLRTDIHRLATAVDDAGNPVSASTSTETTSDENS